MLYKAWMLGEIIVLAMLEDEYATLLEQTFLRIAAQHEVRNLRKVRQSIRRIGKDDVVLALAALQESEHITTDERAVILAELLQALPYEGRMVAVQLHTCHVSASATEHFERDTARSGEEIEGRRILKVNVTIEHIEDILFCKVCCRSCLECAWHIEMATFIYSSDYSHNIISKSMPSI